VSIEIREDVYYGLKSSVVRTLYNKERKNKWNPEEPDTYVEEQLRSTSSIGVGRQGIHSGTRAHVLSGSKAFTACAAFLVPLPSFFW
jgi:hypothetical protein